MAPNGAGQRSPMQPNSGGFVLVMVLALLVILSLLAAAVAASGRRAVTEVQADLDRFEGELDQASTRETLLFMLATQRMNLAGLSLDEELATRFVDLDAGEELTISPGGSSLRMDGTPYQGLGHAMFAIQDDRGLLGINWTSEVMRAAWLKSLGVPADQVADLEAKRLDYQDADSMHRLNGAEAEHYESSGLPPPANRTLSTPLELRRILGWREALAGTGNDSLLGMLTVSRGADININSAPASVLALLPGMTLVDAQRMVDLRQRVPFTSTWQAQQSFPLPPFMDEMLALFPKGSGNLILWDRRFGARKLVHWTLTSSSVSGTPWRIDYEVTLPRDTESVQAMAETPATALLASQGQTRE